MSGSRTPQQNGYMLTCEGVNLRPPAEGQIALLPEANSKLMTLIYSLLAFYLFIIRNKPCVFVVWNTEVTETL